LNLTGDYREIQANDPHAEVWISDDNNGFESPGSGSPFMGRDFVIGADIGTGPNEEPSQVMGCVE